MLDPIEARDVAVRAALAGGAAIRAIDRADLRIGYMTAQDVTTSADRSAHAAVLGVLRESYPEHAVIGEDGDRGNAGTDHVWYVDALDGTANYAAGLPGWCVSVGLRDRSAPGLGMVAAAVHDPAYDELFDAATGHGARLGGRPLAVSDVDTLARGIVVTQAKVIGPVERDRFLAELAVLLDACAGVRVPACRVLALCHVAAGRYVAHCEHGLDAWDLAAGSLILAEAGGRLTGFGGEPVPLEEHNDIVATNGLVHDELLTALERT